MFSFSSLRSSTLVVAALSCSVLACASANNSSPSRLTNDGWHAARVEELVVGPTQFGWVGAGNDCRSDARATAGSTAAEASATTVTWALVYYRHAPATIYRVVAVPAGLSLHVGQEVVVNTQDCKRPLALRRPD